MAILICEMKMPSCCADCPLYDDRWDYPTCYLTNSSRGYTFEIHELRMPDCPIQEVKMDTEDIFEMVNMFYAHKRLFEKIKKKEDERETQHVDNE